MAAFSCQFNPCLFESIFLPSTPIKTSGFMDEESCCFSLFDPPEPIQEIPVDVGIQKSSCDLNHSFKGVPSDNEPSVTKKPSTESEKRISLDKKRKNRKGSSLYSAEPKDGKKQKKSNGAQKDEEVKKIWKVPEEPPTGYIHVRARRGEATDSHSLAERVRREKISERMKMLQRLVPGCDKVTGKALMLDEIINYVQALQNQVEFLSTKLASLNPMYDFGIDLDSLNVSPGRLRSMDSVPQQSLAQCSPIQGTTTAFADATPATIPNIYALLGPSAPLVLQQGQRPNAFSQDNGSSLWDVEDQMQKFLSPSGFSNNVFYFQ